MHEGRLGRGPSTVLDRDSAIAAKMNVCVCVCGEALSSRWEGGRGVSRRGNSLGEMKAAGSDQ